MPDESVPRFCANHPSAHAYAICMSCHKQICHECATRWDGINYCVTCLAAKQATGGKATGLFAWLMVSGTALVLFFLFQRLMVYAAVIFSEAF